MKSRIMQRSLPPLRKGKVREARIFPDEKFLRPGSAG
jgi:hypothetical protein